MSGSPEQETSLSQYGKLLAELARGGVDFAVVGGLAVIFNGYARSTLDVDIIVSDDAGNLDRLLKVLRAWGDGFARELAPADFTPEEGAVRVVEDHELDIFTRLRGRTLDDFRPNLRVMDWRGVPIPYLSASDLIHCKDPSVRDKDHLDVAALREILRREQSH
jgi:hypothetical protein